MMPTIQKIIRIGCRKRKNSATAVSAVSFFTVCIGFLTAVSIPVSGQEAAASEKLNRAIQDARQELKAERARIQSEIQALQSEESQLDARLTKAASDLVERKLALARKQSQREKLRKQRADFRQQQNALDQQRTEMHLITSDAQVKLKDFLETLPPSENRAGQEILFKDFCTDFTSENEKLDYALPLLSLLESLYQESRTSAVFSRTIRDGQGYAHRSKILRVGHILYAYQAADSHGVGLAVAGPEGEKGYRWKEDLPAWAAADVTAAIEGKNEITTTLHLPTDVTQGLAAQRSYGSHAFWNTLAAGGVVMIPLGLVAVLAVILILERFFYLLRQGKQRGAFAEGVFNACHAGDFAKALTMTQSKRGVVPRVLHRCLSQRDRGSAVMEDSVQEAVLHELPGLERFLSAIGILAGVAPLLGLLGTVTGMIATFNAITVFGSGEPRLMAGGISEALLTTAAGLIIAIPILFIHSILSGRVEGLIADMERFSATLINLINKESGAREKAPHTREPQS